MDKEELANAGTDSMHVYCQTKFTQLLGAQWWRRQLAGTNDVVATSPGLIPGTGLGRYANVHMSKDMPDAKTIPEGEIPIPSYPAPSLPIGIPKLTGRCLCDCRRCEYPGCLHENGSPRGPGAHVPDELGRVVAQGRVQPGSG